MNVFRLPSDGRLPWYMQWVDRYVRWQEDAHLNRSEGIPSPEAVDEATDYYAGLYDPRSPDPVEFQRLIRRRGIPDWPNPYDVSDERYHRLNGEGFLWADVQFLVSDLMRKAQPGALLVDRSTEEDECVHNAQICWMMVLQETGGLWPKTLRQVHPDNLVAITMEALLNPHLEHWGLDPGTWETSDLFG